ncbi:MULTISPECIES: glycosyltransferase family 87 protein [unclassified Pedobacter]|uniref:glycosyltransferase family 87 protein n=1 Tax=unclassified Pedobacter TaxID=2628915 RepID=UPI001E28CB23|nr:MULTISPECIES: glycosyltransferase family 87 protein [unclassified Pedobacter]
MINFPEILRKGKTFSTSKQVIIFILWLAIALFFAINSLITHRFNNYLIFENVFRNLINGQSFYGQYPQFHDDVNHYGPIFSLFIAPFALLPNWLGLIFWNVFNCIMLFYALQTLPLKTDKRVLIGYIAIPCLIESMLNQQFNATAAAFIILSFTKLNKNRGFWSSMLIILGSFIKLYGILGLSFFFFVKNKPRFILYLAMWSIVFFILPMFFSSPLTIFESYQEWFITLAEKNLTNTTQGSVPISIIGFFRSLIYDYDIPNLGFLMPGAFIFLIPFLKWSSFQDKIFQLLILASALLFPVLFSTSSEDCTYIISIVGVGLWFVFENDKQIRTVLLPSLLVLCCNFPLLLFPVWAHKHPISLAVLSLPFFIVWLRIIYMAWAYQPEIQEEQLLKASKLHIS